MDVSDSMLSDKGPHSSTGETDGAQVSHLENILRLELMDHRRNLATRQTELQLVTEDRDRLHRDVRRMEIALSDAEHRAGNYSADVERLTRTLSELILEFERLRTVHHDAGVDFDATVMEYRRELAASKRRSDEFLYLFASSASMAAGHRLDLAQIRRGWLWKVVTLPLIAGRILRGGTSRNRQEQIEALEIIESGWFEAEWYLSEYIDVARSKLDPALHYLAHGALEGRNPGPDFDTRFYMSTYLDVTASGMNPLLHFIRHGQAEGRQPIPPRQGVMPQRLMLSGM